MAEKSTIPEIALLERYRNGNCTPEEIKLVDDWFNAHENDEIPLLLQRRSVKQVNQQILIAIKRPRSGQKSIHFFLKVAAILLVVISAALVIYRSIQPQKDTPVAYTTISTKAGERKMVLLPDSSRITLNNLSTIRFATNFDQKIRVVTLSGEAFFDIKHNAERPFIVRLNKVKVQVLGTSFDVKAFQDEYHTKVTVATGKVGVYAITGQPAKMLLPGDQIDINLATQKFTVKKVNADDQHAWEKGIIVLKDEKLEAIARQLERWYKVEITIKGEKLKNEAYHTKLNNVSLNQTLRSLSLSGDGFRYRIAGDKVFINQ